MTKESAKMFINKLGIKNRGAASSSALCRVAQVCACLLVIHSASAAAVRQYLTDGDWARYNSDGTQITFRKDTGYTTPNRFNVFVADADGSDEVRITDLRGTEAPWRDTAFGTANGPAFRPGTGHVYYRDDADLAWYFAYANADDTGSPRNRTGIAGHNQPLRFNADGSMFAFARYNGSSNNIIYIGNGTPTNSGSYSSILSGSSINIRSAIEWGYAGRSDVLAFVRQVSGVDSLYTINSNGSGQARVTDDAFGNVYDPVWAPDGQTIFFRRELNGQWDVWSLNIDTDELSQWTDDADIERTPHISPDGQTMLFSVYDEAASDIDPGDNSIYRLYTLDLTAGPVPEPGSLILLAAGAGLAATRRRPRKHA